MIFFARVIHNKQIIHKEKFQFCISIFIFDDFRKYVEKKNQFNDVNIHPQKRLR